LVIGLIFFSSRSEKVPKIFSARDIQYTSSIQIRGRNRPDGKSIVFSRGANVYRKNLESGEEALVLDGKKAFGEDGVILQEPNMSPDGKYLAITLRGSLRETGVYDLQNKKWNKSGDGCQIDFTADGKPDPRCVFNKPGFEKAQILVAGPNFGCGSSREHAVWGLLQYGIRVVVAPGFGEIFYSNCFNNGLLAARVTSEASRRLFAALSDTTPVTATVDLASQTITAGDLVVPFTVAPRHKTMLAEGLDMIDATLKDLPAIEAFRTAHEKAFPWMTGLPGRWRRERDAAK